MYKIIRNSKIIDVVHNPHFVSFLPTGHIAITDKASAQGIVGSDNQTVYSFKPVTLKNVEVATIKEITIEEFNRLQSLLNSGKEISADESALVKAKRVVIKHLSTTCKNKIIEGFSVTLKDDKSYNFKLTMEDQLNLMNFENQLNSGVESFVYHATGQACRIFSREEMTKIISSFRRHVLYHTTYFNLAKQYINSLTSVEQIKSFAYGTDISDIVEDKSLKQILKNGGNK